MVVKPGPYLTSILISCLFSHALFKADLWHLIVRSHYKPCRLEDGVNLSLFRSKRLRWFGHTCRVSDSRLPKVLMHGQSGQSCLGRPRTVWNNVVLSDIHKLKLKRYTRDALNKPAWRELTCVART